jgi:hypothetical protein
MKIIHFQPENKRLRRQFIRFPFDLYGDDPNWVPPLMTDMQQIFSRKRHSFYEHGEAQFLLAIKDENPVGRLVMLHNHNPGAGQDQDTAHFFYFESNPNPEIVHQLFDVGVNWAKKHRLKKIFGPKGMTPMDGLGLLVRGFEHRPAFGMPYNPAYYPEYMKAYGFKQVRESESGYLNPETFNMPDKVLKAANLVQEQKGFHVLKMRSRKDLKRAVSLLGEMYNAALIGTEGNTPLTENDLETMARGLLWIAQPELIKLILKDDQPVGFLLAYPDISIALQATHGRIFPFGWIRLLWEKTHTDWVNVNGAGIVPDYRGLAATALLFAELYKSVTSSGQFKHAEVIQIGTENERIRQELRGMGIDFYKTHALFELEI